MAERAHRTTPLVAGLPGIYGHHVAMAERTHRAIPPRRASWLSGLLALSLVIAGCGGAAKAPTKVSVILDWYPWSNHTGLYLAQSRGYFKAEGLDVTIQHAVSGEHVQLLATGKIQFSTGTGLSGL